MVISVYKTSLAEPICVRLPKTLFNLVQKLAAESGQSVSEFIRDSLKQRVLGAHDDKATIRAKRLAVGIARIALTDALDAINREI